MLKTLVYSISYLTNNVENVLLGFNPNIEKCNRLHYFSFIYLFCFQNIVVLVLYYIIFICLFLKIE